MSRSTNHRAIVYLCTMSSNKWPPGLRLLRRQHVTLGPQVRLEGGVGLAHGRADAQAGRSTYCPVGDQFLGLLQWRVMVKHSLTRRVTPAASAAAPIFRAPVRRGSCQGF